MSIIEIADAVADVFAYRLKYHYIIITYYLELYKTDDKKRVNWKMPIEIQ